MALMERLVRWSAGVMDAEEMMGTAWMSPQRSRAMVSWRSRARGTSRCFSASIRLDRAEARVFGEVWWHTVNLILCVTGPHPSLHFCQSCQTLNPSSLALLQKRLCVEVSTKETGKQQPESHFCCCLLLLTAHMKDFVHMKDHHVTLFS